MESKTWILYILSRHQRTVESSFVAADGLSHEYVHNKFTNIRQHNTYLSNK